MEGGREGWKLERFRKIYEKERINERMLRVLRGAHTQPESSREGKNRGRSLQGGEMRTGQAKDGSKKEWRAKRPGFKRGWKKREGEGTKRRTYRT